MSNRILSYKGLLADGGQDTILLSTKKGEIGYRIKKFQLIGIDANTAYEGTAQIFKTEQSTIPTEIDFSDNRVLAAAIIQQSVSTQGSAYDTIIIDTVIFNQDIYVVHDEKSAGVNNAVNYYLELEVIKLDESQAMVTTLQDIKNNS